jgi:hypothetical protein
MCVTVGTGVKLHCSVINGGISEAVTYMSRLKHEVSGVIVQPVIIL